MPPSDIIQAGAQPVSGIPASTTASVMHLPSVPSMPPIVCPPPRHLCDRLWAVPGQGCLFPAARPSQRVGPLGLTARGTAATACAHGGTLPHLRAYGDPGEATGDCSGDAGAGSSPPTRKGSGLPARARGNVTSASEGEQPVTMGWGPLRMSGWLAWGWGPLRMSGVPPGVGPPHAGGPERGVRGSRGSTR